MPKTRTIYLSDEEASIFKEIEAISKQEKRGVGFKIIEIFKEWKSFKEDAEARKPRR